MCVSIHPIPNSVRLRVAGDVEKVLTVPYDTDERFLVGLSRALLSLPFRQHCRCFQTWIDGRLRFATMLR